MKFAFRFVYLHEFFHALLGHTEFLTKHFGVNAFSTRPAAPISSEMQETRELRTAFELEADACAFQTLLLELFTGQFDKLFATRGIGVLAVGFIIELMYMMKSRIDQRTLTLGMGCSIPFRRRRSLFSPDQAEILLT